MSSEFDPADFVDSDFQAHKVPQTTTTTTASAVGLLRAPTREEVDTKVMEAQQKLAELKHAQEQLERERASLEETRRRRLEFQTGRQEMLQSLTRGVGLLEEAEFVARRDADQMSRTLTEFRDSIEKIGGISEESWTKDNFSVELTRGLTAIENARMEWNAARLKFQVLSGSNQNIRQPGAEKAPAAPSFSDLGFGKLCKLGLAFTWPLTLVALGALATLIAMLSMRR